jgi:hypothetical protein
MKIGDIVRLPSGSSFMTVTEAGDDNVQVCWMAYNEKILYRATLPQAALILCDKVVEHKTPWSKA